MRPAAASPAPGETPDGADDGLASSALAMPGLVGSAVGDMDSSAGGPSGCSGRAMETPLTGASDSEVGSGSARTLELALGLALSPTSAAPPVEDPAWRCGGGGGVGIRPEKPETGGGGVLGLN